MNLPDDYGSGWQYCRKHNLKWHLSDGCCDYCLDESWGPEPDKLDKGWVFMYFSGDDVVLTDTKPNEEYLILSPGKWAVMHRNRMPYAGFKVNEGEEIELNENEIFVEVPEPTND